MAVHGHVEARWITNSITAVPTAVVVLHCIYSSAWYMLLPAGTYIFVFV